MRKATQDKIPIAKCAKTGSPTYGKDYADIGSLKKLADDLGIAIVLVHHLRKTQDKDDPFNEISGTTGLMGAADTVLLLKKVNRGTDTTFLYLTGRDIEFRAMAIEFTDCYWRLDEDVPPHDGICYRPLSPVGLRCANHGRAYHLRRLSDHGGKGVHSLL